MYLTAVNTVSKAATCSSPTEGAQIISNNNILSTSYFLYFESNNQYPTTLIAWFKLPKEPINWTRITCSPVSVKNIKRFLLFIFSQAAMHFRFTFIFSFVFKNSICKINTITHFTLQGLFYAQWYSFGVRSYLIAFVSVV